jgi:hypothetical protein
MTTSAPQWPGQEGTHEQREEATNPDPRARRLQAAPVRNWTRNSTGEPTPTLTPAPSGAPTHVRELGPAVELGAPRTLEPVRQPAPPGEPNAPGKPNPARESDPTRSLGASGEARATRQPDRAGDLSAPGEFQLTRALDPVRTPYSSLAPDPSGDPGVIGVADLLERRRRQQRLRRAEARRNRFVVVRDVAERDLWVARRRARVNLPSPVAVTRDIALGLLEVEAGCRSAAQLERIFSPRLWEALEHRIERRGGPLPSGRSLISVQCQEDKPGLADTVAVVWRGEVVRPVALRLDACGGRWTVTELRWWRNETDTAMTPGRDGGTS